MQHALRHVPYLQVRQVEILPVIEKHDVHLIDLVRLSQGGDGRAAASDDDGDLGKRRMKEQGWGGGIDVNLEVGLGMLLLQTTTSAI